MILTCQKQVSKAESARAVNWFCVLQAILFKLVSTFSCQVMSLRLKKSITLFKLNLQAFNRRSLTESITLNWDGKFDPDFLSNIRIRTQIPLNFCQHKTQLNSYWHNKYIVLTYTTKRGLFSMIIIIMFYYDCESLKLWNFS